VGRKADPQTLFPRAGAIEVESGHIENIGGRDSHVVKSVLPKRTPAVIKKTSRGKNQGQNDDGHSCNERTGAGSTASEPQCKLSQRTFDGEKKWGNAPTGLQTHHGPQGLQKSWEGRAKGAREKKGKMLKKKRGASLWSSGTKKSSAQFTRFIERSLKKQARKKGSGGP